jgi:hypothetical protein
MKNKLTALSVAFGVWMVLQDDCMAASRQYNQSVFLGAREQAMVNRVQAGITAQASKTGQRGLFNQDCNEIGLNGPEKTAKPKGLASARGGELNVGSFQQANRPREQIIVADSIINLGGHCRASR